MFLMDWALKDVSITVKVKTGWTAVNFFQILPHCTKPLQIQKVLEPLNYETVLKWGISSSSVFRPALEYFSGCIHLGNGTDSFSFLSIFHYYDKAYSGEEMEIISLFWLHRNSLRDSQFA